MYNYQLNINNILINKTDNIQTILLLLTVNFLRCVHITYCTCTTFEYLLYK